MLGLAPANWRKDFWQFQKTNNKIEINKIGTQKFTWFGQIDLRPRAEEEQYFTMKKKVQKCLRKVFLDPKHLILKHKRVQNI